jgi:hypothetical protein
MFKIGLLTSTAMTAVTLLLAGASTGAYAQTDMHVADRDSNARFLCTYGAFNVSHSREAVSGGSYYKKWTHVAVPFTGQGQTVMTIIVKEWRPASGHDKIFSAGIYSSNSHGKPGNLIAGGIGKAPGQCGNVVIPIIPTTLSKNTTYWLEETADLRERGKYEWAVDPRAKHKAYVQHHFSSSNWNSQGFHSSTTPWKKKSSGPWFRLK